jgi:hypothetical protein
MLPRDLDALRGAVPVKRWFPAPCTLLSLHVRATIIAPNHNFGYFIGTTILRTVGIVKPPVVAGLLPC